MENKELQNLINTFKEYRDLLSPIEQNLRAFSVAFAGLQEDITKLSDSFGGDVQAKLDQLYHELSAQAGKAQNLAQELDKFLGFTTNYVDKVDRLVALCERLADKLDRVEQIETKAEAQIARLDSIIEAKKKSYDIKQLEQNLAQYNIGVEKISQYIDTSVAEALKESGNKITAIQSQNQQITKTLTQGYDNLDQVLKSFVTTNELLGKFLDQHAVNEAYLFEILDRWAEDRKLKIKR